MKIIDSHVHIGEPYVPPFGTPLKYTIDDVLRDMDRAGVDMSVVFCIPHAYDNMYTVKAVQQHPDRLIGYAYVDPWHHPEPKASIGELIDLGLKGIKMRSPSLRFTLADREITDGVFETAAHYDVPVLVHAGSDAVESTPLQAAEMARDFPQVKVILAHAGWRTLTHEALRVAQRYPNIILDQTAGHSLQVKEAIEMVGYERVIYGSDAPYMDTRVEIRKIEVIVSDPKQREAILGGNILRILGISV